MEGIYISGFADEISANFDEQLNCLTSLGMRHLSLRSADRKGIADFTVEEVQDSLLPRLQEAGVCVSSIGSPIGKVGIDDEEGFQKQLLQLDRLCQIAKLLNTRYIRMFSFFIPEGRNPADYRDKVLDRLRQFISIAQQHDIVLIHENEKDIYGDIGARCRDLADALGCEHFKACFDFANYVQCGEDTEVCWNLMKDQVVYIHIKDAVTTDKENVLCGTGEGKIEKLLKQAIRDEGYRGFLTLEPHLVIFASLQSLETSDAKKIIKVNKYSSGAEAYAAQYHALTDILNRI